MNFNYYDTDLYVRGEYLGFYSVWTIDRFMTIYRKLAMSKVEEIDHDEVLLYAVYYYGPDTRKLISAEFMNLRMDFDRYSELCSKISANCRLFCLKNR